MTEDPTKSLKGMLTMPVEELAGRIHEHSLSPESLAVALKRNDLAKETLDDILDHTPWLSHHAVQVGLVNNPATPRVHAHKFVYFLFWKELVDVVGNIKVNPALRNAAANLLEEKIGEMSLGEKIAMAKTPVRGIVKSVRKLLVPQVTRAVLTNPATTEEDVLFILTRPNLSVDLLTLIGNSKKWVVRHDIRFQLCRNPRTPAPLVNHLLTTLARKDLEGITSTPGLAPKTREAARDILKKRQAPPGARL